MSPSPQSSILAKAFLLSPLLDYNATHCSWPVSTIQLSTRTLRYTGMLIVCPVCPCTVIQPTSDPVSLFYATQFEPLPVTAELVKRETQRDPVSPKVHDLVMKGWSNPQDEQIKPFYQRKDKLTVHCGVLYNA